MSEIYLQDKVEKYIRTNRILKKDFAKQVGISPVKLSHWLHGRCGLNRVTLDKIEAEIKQMI